MIAFMVITFFVSPFAIYMEWYWLGAVGYSLFLVASLVVAVDDIGNLVEYKLALLKKELLDKDQ